MLHNGHYVSIALYLQVDKRMNVVYMSSLGRSRARISVVSETCVVWCISMDFVLGTEMIIAASSCEPRDTDDTLMDDVATSSSRNPASSGYSRALIFTW